MLRQTNLLKTSGREIGSPIARFSKPRQAVGKFHPGRSFIDDGIIVDGETTVRDKGRETFDYVLAVASGKPSRSEGLGIGELAFVPWQIGAVTRSMSRMGRCSIPNSAAPEI